MYYTYVYLRESGEAYYVGKGVARRAYRPHSIPTPERNLIQMFYFDTEEECWDTEIQLIEFFGRECDGGTLMNQSTGGPGGATGASRSAETRAKMSIAKTGKTFSEEHKAKLSAAKTGRVGAACPNSRHYRVTCPNGETLDIHGLNQFCKERGLSDGTLHKTITGKQAHHKGYTAEKIDG